MKNQLFQILAVSLLLLSCQKQENSDLKTVPTIQEFKNDQMVKDLITYNEYFIKNTESIPNESIQLLKKPNLNSCDRISNCVHLAQIQPQNNNKRRWMR